MVRFERELELAMRIDSVHVVKVLGYPWQTALGAVPKSVVEDNNNAWIGDHCIAAELVPGVFLSNRAGATESPALWDVTATILAEFNVARGASMVGRDILGRQNGNR